MAEGRVTRILSRAGRRVLRWLGAVLAVLFLPIAWLLRHWWGFFRRRGWFGRSAWVLATVVAAFVAYLAVAVPWPGYLFEPPFRAVQYPVINDLQYTRPGSINAGPEKDVAACLERQAICARTETLAARAGVLCAEAAPACADVAKRCAGDLAMDPACRASRQLCEEASRSCATGEAVASCEAISATDCKVGEETWQGWTAEDRKRYYHHPQGSAQVMMAQLRYWWMVNLELPFGRDRFAAPENMARYGFLTDLHQQPDPDWNPGNLPVGFTKYYDEKVGAELLDMTCSLCHTGELHYQGTAIRIDGGQAMHAITDMKPGQFQADLMSSMLGTYINPWKFERFARNVIEPTLTGGTDVGFDFDAAKETLREEFGRTISTLLANAWTDLKLGTYPVFEGYGRTDATQRIANTVFGRHISASNYRQATAPVSYPHLWDIAKFNWVQWEGYASQPMARNINESLGVGARLELFDAYGAPLPLHLRYDTSIMPDRIHHIERTLARLEAPRWPEHLFGPIDLEKAREGRVLFDVHCRHCHGPHLTAHDEPPQADHPPDPNLAVGLVHNADGSCSLKSAEAGEVKLTVQQCLNLHNPQRIADIEGRILYELDDQGRVLGPACRPDIEDCGDAPTHVEQWRVKLIPIRDIGTDRNAALNFADHRYDASRLGWTPEELKQLCVADAIADNIDPKAVSAVVGLNIMSTAITNRYFEKHRPASKEEFLKFMGFGVLDYPRTDPEALKNYKSRPLHGIWATPPFLHNGSVRTIFQMISPRSERQAEFWSGTREYDPVHLGFHDLDVPGAVRFDTGVTGNDNVGHEFRHGCQKNGVIGPFLEVEERFQVLEYIKLMDYVEPTPNGEIPYEPALCDDRPGDDRAACEAEMQAKTERRMVLYPEWGTPAFRRDEWQQHCSADRHVYGDHMPPAPAPDDEDATWELASECSLFTLYLESEEAGRD
ncbi:di-heme-cytochrome C peroxidase [Thioalkalivibrio sp. XN279]|uniref:di-heme-cytochrome C peroxidase n=1 Tax=Thioalkalivibrio sp. XN279 TaxID=2714953 RepID=UPI00140819C3|nr:di-heme-cytochrome C peroxidase [Thioalkalivibrio sp. XN279]NHA14418.1 hypothetical protein [Thioalkalivibrio sp. XN279]